MKPDKYGNKPGSKQQPPGQSRTPTRPSRAGQGLPESPEREHLEEEEEEESGSRREEDDESTGIKPDRGGKQFTDGEPSGSSRRGPRRSNR